MDITQIQQIIQFLSAYPVDVVEAGIDAWRTGKMPEIQGMVADVPLAQGLNELTADAIEYIISEAEEMKEILPYCTCGMQYALMGVCRDCGKGKAGYKSKYVCSCGHDEYFKESVEEKKAELVKSTEEKKRTKK